MGIEHQYPYRLMVVEGDEVLVPIWRCKVRGVVVRVTEVPGCHTKNGTSVMAVHVRPRSLFLRLLLLGRNFSYLGEDAINRIVLVRRAP
ncbi:MAG: hypothetical protein HY420_04100 [Candidatus Kerfeldbacteria bacterium]|nr:hypothetical protein [Candidatus Kerfeldbacteria bacterium]